MGDYEEILNLIAEYAHTADAGDAEAFARLFTPDGQLVHAGVCVAQGELAALLRKRAAAEDGGRFGMKHLQLNIRIYDIRGDQASATVDLLRLRLDPTAGWQIYGVGQYADRLRKVGGTWRFEERAVTWHGASREPHKTGDNSAVALLELPPD